MLVLSRLKDQRILIDGGRIKVVVVAIQPGKVRLGVEAPPGVRIDREEIHEARQADVWLAALRRINEETSPAPSPQPPVPDPATIDWRRAYLGVCEKLDAARQQRDEAIERLVAWKRCPACGLPVPTSGIVCKTGECRCGALVLESDGAAPCDPAAMVAELREQLAVLARQLAAARGQRDEALAQIAASNARMCERIEQLGIGDWGARRKNDEAVPQPPVAPDVAIGRQADELQRMCDEKGLACEISIRPQSTFRRPSPQPQNP